jgi:AcrR family transcriptional regulator
MPPRISFTREEIISAALKVIRKKGADGLTVRETAAMMKGSTQPIYREFGTAESLMQGVRRAVEAIALKYLIEKEDSESNFLAVGMGYLDFAAKEPELFRFLYLSGKKRFDFADAGRPMEAVIEKMRKDPYLKNLGTPVLRRLLVDMTIYTFGLCMFSSMDAEGGASMNHRGLLHDMGGKLIIYEIMKADGKIDAGEMKRRMKK